MRLYPDIPTGAFAARCADLLVVVPDRLLLAAASGSTTRSTSSPCSARACERWARRCPSSGDPVEDLGRRGENDVHQLANVLGFLFAAPPARPSRLVHAAKARQVRGLTAASGVLKERIRGSLRCAPRSRCRTAQLLAYTRDPLGDLAAERYDLLVRAALEEVGLRPASPPTGARRARRRREQHDAERRAPTGTGSARGRRGRTGRSPRPSRGCPRRRCRPPPSSPMPRRGVREPDDDQRAHRGRRPEPDRRRAADA